MSITKRRLASLALGVSMAALLATGPAQAQFEERNIRISLGITDDYPQAEGLRFFAKRLDELSGGKLKAKVFANAALGNDANSTQALRAGTLEMNSTSTSPLSQLIPQLGVFDFPFLFNSEQEADVVLDGPVGKAFEPLFAEKDLVLLCWMENGFRNLTN